LTFAVISPTLTGFIMGGHCPNPRQHVAMLRGSTSNTLPSSKHERSTVRLITELLGRGPENRRLLRNLCQVFRFGRLGLCSL